MVDIGRASLIVSNVLNAIEQLSDNSSSRYTAREALNMALISDDFPVPDYERTTINEYLVQDDKSYSANDKDPEPAARISWIVDSST